MKIKSGFVVREIAGQTVVGALGEASKKFNAMIKLNETGKIIWEMLSESKTPADIVDRIMSEYEVERFIVERDVDNFIKQLREHNVLDD